MKKLLVIICVLIICLVNTSCDSTTQSQPNDGNTTQTEQSSPNPSKPETNLYERYAGTYMFYSMEQNNEMYYVGDFCDGEYLGLDFVVIELYENKSGKLTIMNQLENFTYTITNNSITASGNRNIISEFNITINSNLITLRLGEMSGEIRLKKVYV